MAPHSAIPFEAMDDDESTQRTPKGAEIPVPKRDDFLRDLRKVSEPEPPAKDDDSADDDSGARD